MTIDVLHDRFLESRVVFTDSRKINGKGLFFALKGSNFNGNKYAQQALDQGADLAIVDDISLSEKEKMVFVADALATLQELAS